MDLSQLDPETLASLLAPGEPYVRILSGLAAEQPDAVAITFKDETVTRSELAARSNAVARAYADLGVEEGDYVAIALPNSIDFYVAFLAVMKLGGIALPVSCKLPIAELRAIIDLADARLVVGVDAAAHPGRTVVAADFVPASDVSTEPLPEKVSVSWKASTSGGSTGRPKIIVAGNGAEGNPAAISLLMQLKPDDVQAVVAPLYHNTALSMSINGLLLGQHLVVMERFDAEGLLRAIGDHKISWLSLVPTMMHRMNRVLEQDDDYDLSSVKVLWHMASKCPEWLKQAWIDRIGAEKIWELYGGTELVAVSVITGPEWLEHRGSVGRPVIGEMKVLDEDGTEVPVGEIGEIYMKRPEGAAETYRYIGAEARELDGWTSLGDLGWKDADGYLYISDRRTDMITPGGANVFPAEVENALDQHPRVLSSVVVGLPDEDLGQRVHALVQAEPGTTADELVDFVSAHLVRYKVPRSIEFIDQPLRDDAGKVRRSQMRDEAIERMQANV